MLRYIYITISEFIADSFHLPLTSLLLPLCIHSYVLIFRMNILKMRYILQNRTLENTFYEM